MKESQENMFPHSEVKVKLLKTYLERYLNVLNLSQYFGDVHIFDLFCGEGKYSDGGEGSPLIITKTARSIYLKNRKNRNSNGSFHCYFNDIQEYKTAKVKKVIEEEKIHLDDIGDIKYMNYDYQQLVPLVKKKIDRIGNSKAFVFIDPYGYKEVRISHIKDLLASKKSEVLLFLPTQFMFRFEEKGTPVSLIEFIDELMPIEKWPKSETGIEFIENLTDAFRKAVGSDFFVDSFIITRDKNQFFCLFFFTSHIYGFDRMLDAKWEIDTEEGRGWSYEMENSLFSVSKVPNTLKFEENLIAFLKLGTKTNAEIYEFTLRSSHLPSHATQILTKLQNQGAITVKSSSGALSRTGAFYINYKEYKNNPSRVIIKYV